MSKSKLCASLALALVVSSLLLVSQSNPAIATVSVAVPLAGLPPGPPIGPEVMLSYPLGLTNDTYPAVSYNSNQGTYMVSYRRAFDAYTQLVYAQSWTDKGMTVEPGSSVGLFGDVGQIADNPALAFNATDSSHLLAFAQAPSWNGWATAYAVYDAVVSDSNMPVKSGLWGGAAGRGLWNPHVAWNSQDNEYLVVFSARSTYDGTWIDVEGVRVGADGSMKGTVAYTFSSDNQPQNVNVAYNPGTHEYLVVWVTRSGTTHGLYGARVAANGSIARSAFPIATINFLVNSGNPNAVPVFPSVVARQGGYVVSWQDYESYYSLYRAYFAYLNTNGDIVGAPYEVLSADDLINPVVASSYDSTTDAAVFWEAAPIPEAAHSIKGWRQALYYWPDFTSPSGLSESLPAVAMGKLGYFVVYEGESAGAQRIYGRIWPKGELFLPLISR